jgi:type VI secretion system protein ImpI/type VI secretion system protein
MSSLGNGTPALIVLDRKSAAIGRSPDVDWILPDPYISSRHCEIRFAADRYELIDRSTNGTFLLAADPGAPKSRLAKPHVLRHGDVFQVGPYEIGADFGAASIDTGAARLAEQLWQGLAAVNGIDWQGAGIAGRSYGPASPDLLELEREVPSTAQVAEVDPAEDPSGASWDHFAKAAGIDPARLAGPADAQARQAGALLRALVAGLVAMLDARARAKGQLGAQGTVLALDGNNPLKLAHDAGEAIEMLLAPPMRGFVDAESAVEDAFRDLQAHQLATLGAMQGALRATLARFSPAAIRARADQRGMLSRILPGARAAALWNAYEREFDGVSERADEAFIEVFAAEFRRAYEDMARR